MCVADGVCLFVTRGFESVSLWFRQLRSAMAMEKAAKAAAPAAPKAMKKAMKAKAMKAAKK